MRLAATARGWRGAAGDGLGPVCRHTRPVARETFSRMLLPLRALAGLGELRENVRDAEIRDPLVGRFVRQAARTFGGKQSRGGAALAPWRSRRTRAAIARDSHPNVNRGASKLLRTLGRGLAQQFRQDFRNLKDRAILLSGDIFAQLG